MLKEQLHHEFPEVMAALGDLAGLHDRDLCDLSQALHQTLLATGEGQERPSWHLERIGEAYQIRRDLGTAWTYYRRVLDLEPTTLPTAEQRQAMLTHAPVLLTNAHEFFPLMDLVAIHHPHRSLIAYHLFWQDDYNFPDDLEPCDHEQLWVAYDRDTGFVTDVRTFFHSQILGSAEAVVEANAHGGRPRIRIEWGLHGSLPAGWETLKCDDGRHVDDWLDRNYRGVQTGGRSKDHPLKRRWPKSFEGTWADYLSFTRLVDGLVPLLEKDHLYTSRWANATLQQHALTYNFAVKYDWPFDLV